MDGSASGPSEKDAPPNLTLRAEAFKIIEKLRALLEKSCGRVVSCSDITTLAARDAVFLVSNIIFVIIPSLHIHFIIIKLEKYVLVFVICDFIATKQIHEVEKLLLLT